MCPHLNVYVRVCTAGGAKGSKSPTNKINHNTNCQCLSSVAWRSYLYHDVYCILQQEKDASQYRYDTCADHIVCRAWEQLIIAKCGSCDNLSQQ